LDCQPGDCKSNILLVADQLIEILTCDLAAPVAYNSIHPVYETARAITPQFELLNRRHGSYLDFYYKTGKKEF
jgi:hypothetical protein